KIDEVFEHEEIEEVEDIVDVEVEDIVDVEVDEIEAVEDKLIDNDEIDELPKISDYDAFLAEEEILKRNKDEYIPENNEIWEYIDDIDGVSELLENEEDTSEILKEKFHGLIILNDRR
ncbi:MAG: hypothetical protein MUO60_19700, partial [Clostridiaceae bacterium]|nr:hypothetical protein [Clostridiaceae bacterium]